MGWYSRLTHRIQDTIFDPILPEALKKSADAVLPEQIKQNEAARMTIAGMGAAASGSVAFGPMGSPNTALDMATMGTYTNTGGPEGAIVEQTKEDVTGRLTEEEAQAASQKRLARLSRYYTTVRGDVSPVSTASQKVFS